jgi:Ataxin-3
MDAAASNGGLLYHGVQEGKLCVVHCINTALQGPYFFEFDLAALACDLDQRECLVMLESSQSPARPTLPVGTSTMSPSEAISAFRSVQEFQ